MSELSFPWPDTTEGGGQVGDGREYTHLEWQHWWRLLFCGGKPSSYGVLPLLSDEVLGKLEVSSPGANQIMVNTGAACVNGCAYIADAPVSLSVPSASSGTTRKDRVILRGKWDTGTGQYAVRAAIKQGTADSWPSLTQNEGGTWEIPLARYVISDTGVISGLTQERTYCHFATKVSLEMCDDDIAAAADLAAHIAATSAHGATSSATAGRLILRDANGRAQVATPVDAGDIARKDYVDAVSTSLNNHATAATLAHPDGCVTAAKLASNLDASGKGFNADKVDGYHASDLLAGGVPTGAILLWYGSLGGADGHRPIVGGSPNNDWHLCNGETVNGIATPDLRDRFVIGAGGAYSLGSTGGSATIDLSHTHTVSGNSVAVALSTHQHAVVGYTALYDRGAVTISYTSGDRQINIPLVIDHSHAISMDTDNPKSSPTHYHPISLTSGSALSSTQSILPPYRAVYYIMKVA